MITAEMARENSDNVVAWALGKISKKILKASTKGYHSIKWPLDGVFNGEDKETTIKLQDDLIAKLKEFGYKVEIEKIHYCILDSLIVSW